MVYAGWNGLSTILGNLLNNAIEFTKPDGGISIAAKDLADKTGINITEKGIEMRPMANRFPFQ